MNEGDNFDKWSNLTGHYTINADNSYATINNSGVTPAYDKNGNSLAQPTIVGTGSFSQSQIDMTYDANNQLYDVATSG